MAHGESWIPVSLGGTALVSNKRRKKSIMRISGGFHGSQSKKEQASRVLRDTIDSSHLAARHGELWLPLRQERVPLVGP